MAVFRVHKSKDFTVMSNHHLRNKELSLKAKGLLTLMLSLPEDWDYSVLGLAGLSKDGKDAVMSALNELSTSGYVVVETNRNDRGQYESVYNVFEKPNRENRCGKSESENPPQYNTDNISTDTNNVHKEDNYSSSSNNSQNNNISSGRKNTKKEFDLSFVSVEYLDMMERWIAYHKEIGKPYTKTGVEGAYRRLLTLSNGDARVADQIIEQAIANGWQGLFELRKSKQQTYGSSSNEVEGGFFCHLADSMRSANRVR